MHCMSMYPFVGFPKFVIYFLRATCQLGKRPEVFMSHEQTKIEFITYIYILYYHSSIDFQFSSKLAGFPDILN